MKDPADKLAFEAHVYFDADASGTYKRGYDEDSCYLEKGIDRVRPFVEWLKANKFEGMVGEYGIPDSDSRWNLVLDKFLSYLQENDINGCYWAPDRGGRKTNLWRYSGRRERPSADGSSG